jgi:hypothetical protein
MFFVGHHHASKAQHIQRAFISVNTLWKRKGDFLANDWIMDSGAFSTIRLHGGYPPERSVEAYTDQIARWRRCGNMLRAVAQDYMCEPDMLERTGGTMEEHQRWTCERYYALRELAGDIVMPCLQGQVPEDYVAHLEMYAHELPQGCWVGVGSVCKRKNDSEIREVLRAIRRVRPDLRLHGFGLKYSALRCAEVWDTLYSADSMAWSFAERKKKLAGLHGEPNGLRPALEFAHRIETMPRQEMLI